jgi:hypothetical protein
MTIAIGFFADDCGAPYSDGRIGGPIANFPPGREDNSMGFGHCGCGSGFGFTSAAVILVLFILLVIVLTTWGFFI